MKLDQIRNYLTCITLTILMAGCGDRPSQSDPNAGAESSSAADPMTLALDAAINGDITGLQQAFARGLDVNATEPVGGGSLLMTACYAGQQETVAFLLAKGADLEQVNHEGSTALLTATFMCHPDTVSLLLEKGAHVNAKNKSGSTALDMVATPWSPQLEGIYQLVGNLVQRPIDLERIKNSRGKVAEILKAKGAKFSSEL